MGVSAKVGTKVRSALVAVFDGHQTGYGEETTHKLVRIAINQHQLDHRIARIPRPIINSSLSVTRHSIV